MLKTADVLSLNWNQLYCFPRKEAVDQVVSQKLWEDKSEVSNVH